MSRRKNARRVASHFKNYQDSDSNSDNECDDIGLAFISLVQTALSKPRRKSVTPKRKPNKIKNPNPKKSPAAAVSRKKINKKQVTVNPSAEVCVDSDSNLNDSVIIISDTLKDSYAKNVQHKVDTFFKSVTLMSDDDEDDEVELPKKPNVPPKPTTELKDFYELSDSDEELPSTSNGKTVVESKVVVDLTSSNKDEDLMEIVDRILDCDDTPVEINTSNVESDNWNDFKSKAEEIMGSVTALLDTLKDDKDKLKEKPPPEASPVKAKPSCPVCLEVLDGDIAPGATICGHIFCMTCIKQVAKTSKSCPTCRKHITIKQIHPLHL